MIKNYVFDIGNVLAEFNAPKMLHYYFNDPQLEKQIFHFLFPDLWNSYDQGLISEQEIINRLSGRFPEYEEQIRKMMNGWTDLLVIHQENLEAVRQIGSDCYILSNLPEKAELALRSQNFFDPFRGALCSWREKLIKPDPKIFELFLEQNQLRAEECLFIDDRPDNVKSAASAGFHAVCLRSIDDLRNVLSSSGAFEPDC